MRISDWSSDVCSSDLVAVEHGFDLQVIDAGTERPLHDLGSGIEPRFSPDGEKLAFYSNRTGEMQLWVWDMKTHQARQLTSLQGGVDADPRSEEHTSELQSLMSISYAVFCLKKKKQNRTTPL